VSEREVRSDGGCRGVYKERKPKTIGVIKLHMLSEKKKKKKKKRGPKCNPKKGGCGRKKKKKKKKQTYGTQLHPDYWVVLAVKQGLNDGAWRIKTVKRKSFVEPYSMCEIMFGHVTYT